MACTEIITKKDEKVIDEGFFAVILLLLIKTIPYHFLYCLFVYTYTISKRRYWRSLTTEVVNLFLDNLLLILLREKDM